MIRQQASKDIRLLASSAVAVPHTGTVARTTLATVTVPAGAMGTNGALRITTVWSWTNNGNTKTTYVAFGGTDFSTVAGTTTASVRNQCQIHNRNSASSQVSHANPMLNWSTTATAVTTSSINTAAAQNITFDAMLGSAGDTITLEAYTVELIG